MKRIGRVCIILIMVVFIAMLLSACDTGVNVTITFNSNGGSDVSSITKKAGQTITAPTAPTKEGYTFVGWYTDNNTFNNEYIFETMPAEDITVFARWQEIEIVIIDIPVAISNVVYDGEEKVGVLEETHYTIENGTAIESGEYIATVSLVDPIYTRWDDGTTEDKNIEWTINKAEGQADVSTVVTTFTYTGEQQSISGATGTGEVSYEDNSFTNAGDYTVAVNVAESDNYLSTNVTVDVVVEKATITGISFEGETFTYDGTAKSTYITADLPDEVNVEYVGNNQINAGEYTVTAQFIVSDNYNAIEDMTATLEILKKQIDTPQVVFDGSLLDWEAIEGASSYIVEINGTEYNTNDIEYYVDETITSEVYTIRVKAVAIDQTNYLNPEYSEIIRKLPYPENLNIANGIISWDEVEGANNYLIHMNSLEAIVSNNATSYRMLNEPAGEYTISITAYGNNSTTFNSNESPSINATKLGSPTISEENNILVWTSVDNATGYVLVMNDSEIDVGDVTSYYLTEALSGAYSINVYAKGDNEQYINSRFSNNIAVNKLADITGFGVENGVFVWDRVNNANKYSLWLNDAEIIVGDVNEFALDESFQVGSYTLKLRAGSSESGYLYSNYTESITTQKLPVPTNLTNTNEYLTWTEVDNAVGYLISIGTSEYTVGQVDRFYAKDIQEQGNQTVRIKSLGNQHISSDFSEELTFNILPLPQNIQINDGVISWDEVPNATGYILLINDNEINNALSQNFTLDENYDAEAYSIKIRAEGDGDYLSSYTETISLTKLATPSNLAITNGKLTFDTVQNASGYRLIINGDVYEDTSSPNYYIPQEEESSNISIQVLALGDDIDYVKSEYTEEFTGIKLATPVITVSNGIVTWQSITNAVDYILYINDTETNVGNVTNYSLGKEYQPGEYGLRLRAIGDNTRFSSAKSDMIETEKISAPDNISYEDSILSWQAVDGATGYRIKIGETIIDLSGGGTTTCDLSEYDTEDKAICIMTKHSGLYSNYRVVRSIIIFDGNGATSGAMGALAVIPGDTVNLPANGYENEGYIFIGWSLTTDGEVLHLDEAEYTVGYEEEYRLYAKWSPTPTRSGNYIWFGEYPQTIKADSVTVGTTADSDGYFLGSDGERYSKVVANPHDRNYTFSNDATVTDGTTYYFKVEPIKWRILEENDETALILAELIIDNHRYDAGSNNYKNSDIRAWLNNQFYNTAFNDLQKGLILTTNVDNSVYSTGYDPNQYACEDTNDKIFLPSYHEVVESAYGFSNYYGNYDTARTRVTSDYSRATGAYMSTSDSYYGNGYWWLRSPSNDSSYRARYIYYGGYVFSNSYVFSAYNGVVPALRIKIS